ncbi:MULTISPECIES: thiol reductant ABC exporter subunit CydD [unclassified Rhizobium]|uniref:thiol reductant ABC exporter subunit CydD n=1 Tax=Rhizobium TaxID=379 RepID=UPI00084BD721|nr:MULTISPECIES: thiol reductant ABC exporter subunit CydD [unclassified Rhizobium]OEC95678.1 thiol reductant ABC exporter subunit CydD [Rhizobium sp. YK2]QYA15295.1 thiol reductant ABC exporter subunit CydD [Rhizobium sp. AB2/73]UEQ83838.1 thiol reductant ABC exporter subunit CydD [Rhizobium sp. AB2/73]
MTTAFFDTGSEVRREAETDGTDSSIPPSSTKDGSPRTMRAKLSLAALVQTLASLLWIPQAALLASGIGVIADTHSMMATAVLALLVFLLGALRAGLDALGGCLAFRAARAELSRRREIAVAALAARSPLDSDRPASGFAASLIAEQAEAIVPYLARFHPARLKASVIPPAILICVASVSWIAALVLLLTAPLIPVFMALIGWRAKAASEKQLAETGGLNAFLLDRLRGLATIRALDAVDRTALRLRADVEQLKMRTMAVLRIAFLSSAVLELFAALGVAAMAVYVGFNMLGALDVGTWSGRLSLTQGLFILLLAPSFFEPLRELSAVWHDRAAGEAALEALDALSSAGTTLPGRRDERVAETSRDHTLASINVGRLRFRHRPEQMPVFHDFSLAIAAGEHVALVGESGAGKTTMLSLIAGLVRSERGTIHVGGRRLDDISASALRQRMAWIGQRPHIFAGTMTGNITLGRPEVSPHAVQQAIDLAHLRRIVTQRGATSIGEGGAGLSGGEALRLAIARAAAAPHVDIILADEPTAHLDTETAREVTDALLAIARGRTLVVATHDPVLAARMGRVIHIDASVREEAA